MACRESRAIQPRPRTSIARSSRRSVRSRPSATSVSNSGGVAVRPVTATRIVMNRSPAFQPLRLGEGAERRLQLVGLERQLRDGRDRRAGGLESPARAVAASQRLGTSVAASRATSSTHRNPTRSPTAPSVGRRSWIDRQEGAELVVRRHPLDPSGPQLGLHERPQPVDQLVRREAPDPLAVQPLEALAVEHRAALVDGFELEALDDLVDREDLLLGAGRPAEEREVVDQRLADEALRRCSPRPRSGSCACSSWYGRRSGSAAGGRTAARRSRARGTAARALACWTGGPRRG